MVRGRRQTDEIEDDGRVIADMSGVERPSLFGHMPGRHERRGTAPSAEHRSRSKREPAVRLTTKERVWLALGALKAGFLLSMVYVVLFVIVLLALSLLWGVL